MELGSLLILVRYDNGTSFSDQDETVESVCSRIYFIPCALKKRIEVKVTSVML